MSKKIARARALRRMATGAEIKLWNLLRNRNLNGVKFRRQYPIGKYVADFYCPLAKLVIEVDGGGHARYQQMQRDVTRSMEFEKAGIRVLRFLDSDVLRNPDAMLERIYEALESSHSAPLPVGEGSPVPHRRG